MSVKVRLGVGNSFAPVGNQEQFEAIQKQSGSNGEGEGGGGGEDERTQLHGAPWAITPRGSISSLSSLQTWLLEQGSIPRPKRNPICGELFKTSSLQNHKRTHTKRKFSKFLPDRFLTWKFILQFFSQITFGRVYSTAIDPILSRTSKAPTAIPILEKILQKHTKNHTKKTSTS